MGALVAWILLPPWSWILLRTGGVWLNVDFTQQGIHGLMHASNYRVPVSYTFLNLYYRYMWAHQSLGIKLKTLSKEASVSHQDQHAPFRQKWVVNMHLQVQTRFKFLYCKYADIHLLAENYRMSCGKRDILSAVAISWSVCWQQCSYVHTFGCSSIAHIFCMHHFSIHSCSNVFSTVAVEWVWVAWHGTFKWACAEQWYSNEWHGKPKMLRGKTNAVPLHVQLMPTWTTLWESSCDRHSGAWYSI